MAQGDHAKFMLAAWVYFAWHGLLLLFGTTYFAWHALLGWVFLKDNFWAYLHITYKILNKTN